MNQAKRQRLEAAGWKVGSAEDFLALTPEERAYLELKLNLSEAIKKRRMRMRLSQMALAARLKSSQSRIAKMEKGDPSVSVDLLLRALFAIGATKRDIAKAIHQG